MKWNISLIYCLFPYFLVQTIKTVLQWIIVQDDKIQFHPMNLIFCENIARVYVSVNLLLIKCILVFVCVYFLYCDTLKNTPQP